MGVLETLLTVQDHDTAMAQLRHRRANLAEQAALDECLARVAALDKQFEPSVAEAAELTKRQSELETSIAEVDAKITTAEKQLYSGTVSASRELQALEADIASLKRRRSELEDAELEILVAREPLDASLSAAAAQRDELQLAATARRVEIAAAAAVIDRELSEHASQRTARASELDDDVMSAYEKVRDANRGVGAARLEHGTCMACRMKLSAVYLDTIRRAPAESVVRCEECSAILVR